MDGWETKRHNPNYDWYVYMDLVLYKSGGKRGIKSAFELRN